MSLARRGFLAGTGLAAASSFARTSVAQAQKPLNILIIGGTGFVGPPQVEYALARGHKVSVLNRNRKGDIFSGKVEQLIGDLNDDVSVLQGRSFDVVIDNPTIQPSWVRNVAQYLKGHVAHYIYISTVGVYDLSHLDIDENTETKTLPPDVDPYNVKPEQRGKYYQELKAVAEREVQKTYPGKNSIVRCGLVSGPHDDTDCFMYWATRVARGGTVLAPGSPTDPVKYIDTRDIGEFVVHLAENGTFGNFNAVGPEKPLSISEFLYGIKAVTTANAQFEWVPAKFLVSQQVAEWTNMPIWVDPSGPWRGLHRINVAKTVAAGLTFRSLADTAQAALAWDAARPEEERKRVREARRYGLTAEREAAVLAAWQAERRSGKG